MFSRKRISSLLFFATFSGFWCGCALWDMTSQVKQPRLLTTIYGLIRPSWPYFTVTLRVTWLRITTISLRIVYDEIRSSMGTRKWLLLIIVDVRCTLLHAYIVYGPNRHITELVYDRKRLLVVPHRLLRSPKFQPLWEICNVFADFKCSSKWKTLKARFW